MNPNILTRVVALIGSVLFFAIGFQDHSYFWLSAGIAFLGIDLSKTEREL